MNLEKLAKLVQKFENYLLLKRRSKHTLRAYSNDLQQLNRFVILSVVDTFELNEEFLLGFKQYIEDTGIADSTINRKLMSVSSFLNYLVKKEGFHPIEMPELKKVRSRKSDGLDKKEVCRIIRQSEQDSNLQAIAFLNALAYTGGRVNEVLQIKTKDINSNFIEVIRKGGFKDDLMLPKRLKPFLKKYAESKAQESELLFDFQARWGLSIVKRYGGLARIKLSNCFNHAFRGVYAEQLETEVRATHTQIKDMLGHAQSTTEGYTSSKKMKVYLDLANKLNFDTRQLKKPPKCGRKVKPLYVVT
jgi:integrase/recombinase XerD